MTSVDDWIQRWLPHTDITPTQLWQRINSEKMILLVMPGDDGVQAIAGVELSDDSVHVTMVAGQDVHRWLGQLVEVVTGLAESQGRARITTRGRRGWDRLLAPYGFRREGDELNKVVKHGIQ